MDTTKVERVLSTGEPCGNDEPFGDEDPYDPQGVYGVPWATGISSLRSIAPSGRLHTVLYLASGADQMSIVALEAIDWAVAALLQHHRTNGWCVLKQVTQQIHTSIVTRGIPIQAPRKEPIPPMLRRIVLERDAYRCQRCDSWLDLAVDHIIPESKGGQTVLENLQTLCRPCNSRKGTSL